MSHGLRCWAFGWLANGAALFVVLKQIPGVNKQRSKSRTQGDAAMLTTVLFSNHKTM